MSRSRPKTLIFASIPTLALIGLFLLGFIGQPENDPWLNASSLWGPGDPFYSGSETTFIHSPLLIWRGRPDYRGEAPHAFFGIHQEFALNELGLRDDPIGPKDENTVRVLNLGNSATFGLNLRDRSETYSDQLEALLESSPGGTRYDVINAGTVGYSSLQGLEFLRQTIGDLAPDIVTVYLGNNDPAPSGSDRARMAASSGGLRRLLHKNYFYLLARKGLLALSAKQREARRQSLIATVRAKQGEAFASKESFFERIARSTPDDFEQNLRDLVAVARAHGARTVLIRPAQNLPWPHKVLPGPAATLEQDGFWSAVFVQPGSIQRARSGKPAWGRPFLDDHPYLSFRRPGAIEALLSRQTAAPGDGSTAPITKESLESASRDESLPLEEQLRAAHNRAVWHLAEGELDAGAARLERALSRSTAAGAGVRPAVVAQICHQLGIARWTQGRGEEGFMLLKQAREIFPFAISADYLQRIDRVGEDLGVQVLDAPALFAAADPKFRGSTLLHDWVHPNRAGNRILAEALAEAINTSG